MEDHGETDGKLPLVTELIKRMLDLLDMTKEADLLFATPAHSELTDYYG
jgi:hypothetical protein